MKEAVTIAEIKYPSENYNIVVLFDQSSGHTSYDEDALIVSPMNVKPGGCQPKMRDTFRMVFDDGTPKGMRQVRILIDRKINVKGMVAADMQRVLGEMQDFKYERRNIFLNESTDYCSYPSFTVN